MNIIGFAGDSVGDAEAILLAGVGPSLHGFAAALSLTRRYLSWGPVRSVRDFAVFLPPLS